jgi:hypothetical protein
MNVLQALDHPDLLAGQFDGPSWAPWRTFLHALFALPNPSPRSRRLFGKCTERIHWPVRPFREAALIVGRRGGKSRALALIAVYVACFIDWRPFLATGETATIAVLAADRKQASVIMGYIRGFLRNVEVLDDLIDVEQVETVRLDNRVQIEVYSARIASPRGRTFAAVLCDEISFWRSDDSANPDKEVIAGIRPGLATLPGSMLLMASSPYAKRGVLWDSFKRHFGRDASRMLVWKAPSLVMNPSLDPAIVKEAYEDDPTSAASEFGAEFRSDVATYIDREIVDACTQPNLHERLPVERGISYSAFVDPSGGSADSFTLAIAHRDGDRGILDCVRERRPPFSPESVVKEFADLLQRYSIHEVTGDHYAGEWPRERFREHAITYLPSDKNKSSIYGELLPLLNSGKVELLDHPRLAIQLASLERRTARGGKDSIDHPPHAHDDVANAAAGVLVRVAGKMDINQVWARL